MAITDYNPSAGLNATIGGINVSEGASRAGMNDAIRQLMADLAQLPASGGSSLLGFTHSGTGATKRTLQDRGRDTLNVKDFGAIGDGFLHPLSGRFATLAEAQAVYPFVTSLTQSRDSVGIQAALNEAARDVNRRGTVWLPLGYYVLTESLELPSFVTFQGESRHGSVLYNQVTPLAAPQIVNQDPVALIYSTIRDMALFGGTYGVRIDASSEIAALAIENVSMVLQTAGNFYANKQVQTSRFLNVSFDANNLASNCWRSNAGANNANIWIGCDFLNATDAHFFMSESTGNQLIGCRFEGGGGSSFDGKRTIQLNAATALSFTSCYFETTHEYLMEAAASFDGSISFTGCEFIGPVDSGDFRAYKWIADKDVTFSACSFFRATTGPTYTIKVGANPLLTATIPAIASASTIALPSSNNVFSITGTTSITNITATAQDTGRVLHLTFADVLTFTDGGNLKLAGNLATTADDTISLFYDGTNWRELARAVN